MISLTEDNIKFIKANRLEMSGTDMAKSFGVSKGIVNRYMRKNGLAVSKETALKFRRKAMTGRTTSTPEIDKILKNEYLNLSKLQLSLKVGKSETFVAFRIKQLGLVIPKELIEERNQLSRFKKGNIPMNKGKKQIDYMSADAIKRTSKTRFKKGDLPSNTKHDGAISIRKDTDSGLSYKYVRIKKAKWELYQRVIWEEANGSIPEGHLIRFKDGDQMNCDLSNLECISMADNARRNKNEFLQLPQSLKELKLLNNKLNKAINETRNKKSSGAPE